MSLDVYLTDTRIVNVYEANITHNLNRMAKEAGLYEYLWRPDEVRIKKAKDLITPLTIGLKRMKDNPGQYKKLEPENKWGTYDDFIDWIERYIEACIENPEAEIEVSR